MILNVVPTGGSLIPKISKLISAIFEFKKPSLTLNVKLSKPK